MAEGELAPELRDELLDRSGGNPFFLEELVAFVVDGDVDGGIGAESGAATPRFVTGLPDTLRGLVAARIDGLSADERGTLEDASVWGRSGPVEALERMADEVRSVHDVGPVLAGLVDKDIFVVSGRRWSFRSDLLREVAYGTMTKADRARRHYGIAHFLEHHMVDKDDASLRAVDVIAHHYAAAAELAGDIGLVEWVPSIGDGARPSTGWKRRRSKPRCRRCRRSPIACSGRPSSWSILPTALAALGCCSAGRAPRPRFETSTQAESLVDTAMAARGGAR